MDAVKGGHLAEALSPKSVAAIEPRQTFVRKYEAAAVAKKV